VIALLLGGPAHGRQFGTTGGHEVIEVPTCDSGNLATFNREVYRCERVCYGTEEPGGDTQTVREYRVWLWAGLPRTAAIAAYYAAEVTARLIPDRVRRGVPIAEIPADADIERPS
jgi:hypothetical protein